MGLASNQEAFRVLVADPPWKFGDSLPGRGRGASKHYPCMTLPTLRAFELPPMAANSLLFMWRVAAMQADALELAAAWGFTPKTEIVWHKLTATGKTHFGMGHYARASHESCLVCVRGRPVIRSHSIRSVFSSEKPSAFFSLVEELSDGPYVELFARRHRVGWQCLGNELEAAE
jgi:N6-adenosine-specific RNA methylase IME4